MASQGRIPLRGVAGFSGGHISFPAKKVVVPPPDDDNDDDEDDDFGDDDFGLGSGLALALEEGLGAASTHAHPNAQGGGVGGQAAMQPKSLVARMKHSGKINLEDRVESLGGAAHTKREGDKSERATVEKVLDPRTRLILFKMVNNGMLGSIDGCVSTGKEANVYHATAGDGQEYAIKVYQTSILQFRDRDKYVTGEFRFRRGYCKGNPRKMVRTWAEKELRNLKRLQVAGLPCPQPILLRQHVLVMQFLGSQGWPAPRLHDVF
eukprot:RCo050243